MGRQGQHQPATPERAGRPQKRLAGGRAGKVSASQRASRVLVGPIEAVGKKIPEDYPDFFSYRP